MRKKELRELLTPKGVSFFLLLPVTAFYDSPQA